MIALLWEDVLCEGLRAVEPLSLKTAYQTTQFSFYFQTYYWVLVLLYPDQVQLKSLTNDVIKLTTIS